MVTALQPAELKRSPLEPGFAILRRDFPILRRTVHGKPLVYFDNAATTQKPQAVIDAVSRFYSEENANVHRGVHSLSELATAAYEAARTKVQRLLKAEEAREIDMNYDELYSQYYPRVRKYLTGIIGGAESEDCAHDGSPGCYAVDDP